MFYSFCFLSTSVFALGATLWPKNNVFKTIGATIGLNIVLVWLTYLGFKLLLTGVMHTSRFQLDVTTAQIYWAIAGIVFIFALFFWTLSYFRMKEWEVIKRW